MDHRRPCAGPCPCSRTARGRRARLFPQAAHGVLFECNISLIYTLFDSAFSIRHFEVYIAFKTFDIFYCIRLLHVSYIVEYLHSNF